MFAPLLVLSSMAVAGRCDTTASCLRAVEAAQQKTSSLSARFVQTKHVSLLAEPLTSSGRFLFKRPNHVLWQVEQPQRVTVLIDAQGIHVPGMTQQDRQALAMAPMTAFSEQLTAIFAGALAQLQQRFDVSAADNESGIQVHLVPREESLRRFFRTIDVRFADPALAIRDIRLEDGLGDRVEVVLEDVQINPDLPDSLFAIDTPPREP